MIKGKPHLPLFCEDFGVEKRVYGNDGKMWSGRLKQKKSYMLDIVPSFLVFVFVIKNASRSSNQICKFWGAYFVYLVFSLR